VFAYVGRPAKGEGPFPAMVLVHGGGGQAFREWSEYWAGRGYVSIAMDLGGRGPGPGKARHADAGPAMGNPTIMMAADSDEALHDGWTYHAVAAAVRGHSVLLTMPEVDPDRVGITGISWGGYTTGIVAGVDHRLKVAVPVYGCGYLQDNSYWTGDVIDGMMQDHRDRWVQLCDPSSYLGKVSCPILFLNGSNDPRFYLDITFRSALLVRPEYRNLAILIGLKHGHDWKIPEVDRFVDSVLAGGAAVPRFGTPETEGRKAKVRITGDAPRMKGFINYAAAGGPWKDRQWETAPASVSDGMITATLPGGKGFVYYFSITDKAGVTATSECGATADVPLPGGGGDGSVGPDLASGREHLAPSADPGATQGRALQSGRVNALPSAFAAKAVTNSIGMELVSIEPGAFQMGEAPGKAWFTGGEWDESPVRKVEITQPFLMSATEVTNEQYEQFDPSHRAMRGQRGFAKEDDEAVTFASWEDATRFCEWLGAREGKPYRLPTEAEWEYACRAGTTTAYATGDKLPSVYFREQSTYEDHRTNHGKRVSLKVKQSPPNAWGLYDMHGNLEEWCHDWYGAYDRAATRDPAGRGTGYARVTRGGSHNTDVYYLRSANRSSALPDDAGNFYIGFRVAQAPLPASAPSPAESAPLVMRDVSQEKVLWKMPGYDSEKPWFRGPRPYVKVAKEARGPLFWFHNHDPAITYCDNGDLLAIWFTTQREWGRELAVAGSRLRHGYDEWDPASLFFDLADRNDHAPAFWRDENGRLYHFNGTGLGFWGGLSTVMRTSDDNGATWSRPQFIKREHASPAGCVESVIKTKAGRLIVPVDGSKSTELLVSDDEGKTWRNPAKGMPADDYKAGGKGRRIAGIHAALVELDDGGLLAIGRGADINDRLAMSRSRDQGETWEYSASEFPPISAGQRPVIERLKEGPLMVVSFTDKVIRQTPFELGVQRGRELTTEGMIIKDAAGKKHRVHGMFAALSFDEGKTWPVKKLITPGGEARTWFGHGWTKLFVTSDTAAEPMGYLASVQTPDGRIHLISSGLHYEFNLAWLKEPMPARK
jgi:formylglycine-generating enzyme required for sulfatase activity/dienelactone hydrolase